MNDNKLDFDLNKDYDGEDEAQMTQDLHVDEVYALNFKTEDETYGFYQSYAKYKGFSVRKGSVQKRKDGTIRLRIFLCSREGERSKKDIEGVERKREPKGETRVGCGAHLRIRYDKEKDVYVVASFEVEHSHALTPLNRVQFLRSHRSIDNSVMAEARALHSVGISSSKIMDYMVVKNNEYENCGFTLKDLTNALDSEYREDILEGDAETALAYLTAKSDCNPLYYYKYTIDNEDRLEMLFWADSKSRDDYAYFGEALTFDATYRTNIYNKPFVMLVGVNNHYQTTMFGCALLPNELESTYKWVLETFLDAMQGKKPSAVITDGDKAMRGAIVSVFPDAVHRLCKWHIQKNVTTNIHIKGFIDEFTKLMDEHCTPEEFEVDWTTLVEKYELGNNSWLPKLYNTRKLWAAAYLRGKFFANMRTTGRCEGFNGYFNGYLNKRLRIFKFVRAFDRALLKVRHNETIEIHKTEETFPFLRTKLYDLERHAAEVFTRNMFKKVRTQIELTIQIFEVQSLSSDNGELVYYMSMYKKTNSTWIVRFDPNGAIMKCDCLLFESIGIPCCHMFQVMKIHGMKEIPKSLIMDRWTKNAKHVIQSSQSIKLSSEDEQVARYGSLSSRCNKMSYFASHTFDGWKRASEVVDNLTGQMEEL